jgi:hypothetical protein
MFDNVPERHGTIRLRYRARVVNAGRFVWERAVMQLSGAPTLLPVGPTCTVEIRAQ